MAGYRRGFRLYYSIPTPTVGMPADSTAKTYGSELNFYIPKNCMDSLENAVARINVPAFSGFSGGAYVRYVNNCRSEGNILAV